MAFWVNLTGGVDYPRIIAPSDDRDLWAYFAATENRGVSFRSRGTGVVDPGFPPYGGWEHFAINFDTIADIGTIYRNGVQVMSGFYGDNSPVQSLTIGHHGNLANHQIR